MPSTVEQTFYQGEFIRPIDMNLFYSNIAEKLSFYFPIQPAICSGIKYTQSGTSNSITFETGFARFFDQPNELSSPTSIATFAPLNPATVSISCADGQTRYIVAFLTIATATDSTVSYSADILPNSMTLAEIAAQINPKLYVPLFTINNTNGIYNISTNGNCAYNYGNMFTIQNNATDVINAFLTPTFQAGEQYILSPVNFNGSVQQTVVLNRSVKDGTSTGAGSDSVEFVMTRNSSTSALLINFQVISSTLLTSQFGFKSTILSSPAVINNITIPSGSVIYSLYLKTNIPNNNTINKVSGCYLSASTEFIDNSSNYPVLFEPIANGTLVGTSGEITFTTNATVNQLQDSSFNASLRSINAINGVTSSGIGSVDGYGFVAITPKGVFAQNGDSQLGNIFSNTVNVANRTTAGFGVICPNTPNTDGVYPLELGWKYPRVVGRVNNNNSVLFTLANYSDVVNNGVGIVASGFLGGINWIKYAPDVNGKELIVQWGRAMVITGGSSVTLPMSYVGSGSDAALMAMPITPNCIINGNINSGSQLQINTTFNTTVYFMVQGY